MAYATGGSGLALTDLMDALRSFALGQGWTIDKWDSTNRLLFMTKGLCTVTMKGLTTQNVTVFTGANASGVSSAVADHRLYMAMGTSNTAGSANYHSHPGSPVTTDTDGDAPYVNGLNGPFIAWHFFADATVSDHIHCVVEIKPGIYMHFSIGHVDKRGLTHSGVAYVTATPNYYFRNVSNWLSSAANSYNHPWHANCPFAWSTSQGGGHVFSSVATYQNNAPCILKHANAWPATWQTPIASASGTGTIRGILLGTANISVHFDPVSWPSTTFTGNQGLLSGVVVAEPTPYSNVTPLFPLPVFRYHYDSAIGADSQRMCYLGDFPNVRLCNMTNLLPGQEITVGAETFKVFPILRQTPWADRLLYDAPTSGQWAIAYKKVP